MVKQEIIHSIKQAKERYDLDLTESDYNNLVNQIKQNKAEFLRRISNTRSLWILSFNKGKKRIRLPAMYDKTEKLILTILPRNYLKKPSDDYRLLLLQITDSQDLKECFGKVKEMFCKIEQLEGKPNKRKEIEPIEKLQFRMELDDE